nr:RNA-directed DNA polymerase, eukaryota, reverse transcriptase zinc-binding domain protein [Tanacetum cinerariifolium]
MGIGTTQEEVNSAANIIGCNTFSTPFNYFGVKVGGRFTLIKSVLSSLPLYQMSVYKAPMGVLHRMESIRRRFFNGANTNEDKMSMIGWQKIMASRKKGGLASRVFFAQNRALLFKWIWRSRSQESSLWYRVLKAMFGDHGSLDNPGNVTRPSNWLNIICEFSSLSRKGIHMLSYMKKKVRNGLNTFFWTDAWLSDSPFMHMYLCMYALECNKVSTVADKLSDPTFIQSFRRPPRGGLEEEQYVKLIDIVNSNLSDSKDRWVWSLDSTGEFSVKSARLYIDDYFLLTVGAPTRWDKEVPIKINILAWKVSLDKLPTRLNLSLRRIEIPSISCHICCTVGESCSHLLFSCIMAQLLISKVARWWELDIPDLLPYEDWLD